MAQSEAIKKSVTEYLNSFQFSPQVLETANKIVSGIIELAALNQNSDMDSSLHGNDTLCDFVL